MRLFRAARTSTKKIAVLAIIEDSSGLPDPASRQRYVEFMDSLANDAVGVGYVLSANGFPAAAHRAVLNQMNEQGRHGLPTFATETDLEALAWLEAQGAAKDDTKRLAALKIELNEQRAALSRSIAEK